MMTSRSLICLLENQNGSKLQKNCYLLNLRAPKNFCMQLVSKVSFFYSTDLRTRFAHLLHNSNLLYEFYKTPFCRTRYL
jgi:hypothetical protein